MFFLLGVELRVAGVLMVADDATAEVVSLVGPDSGRFEGGLLRDAVTTVAKTCGVDNVARIHYGQCTLFEVDFISSNQVLKLLKTLQSHTFETNLLELLSKLDSQQLNFMKLSLSVKLYLAKPLLAQKECSLTTVTLSNYRDCLDILTGSMIFDYQATRDNRFTRPGDDQSQLVISVSSIYCVYIFQSLLFSWC